MKTVISIFLENEICYDELMTVCVCLSLRVCFWREGGCRHQPPPYAMPETTSLTVRFLSPSLQLCPATRVVILGSYSMATSRGPHSTLETKSATAAAQATCWRVTLRCLALPLQRVLLHGISRCPIAEVCRGGEYAKLSIIAGKLNSRIN